MNNRIIHGALSFQAVCLSLWEYFPLQIIHLNQKQVNWYKHCLLKTPHLMELSANNLMMMVMKL